jgi:PIN domain nuclease of toxin-antitoxin system
VAILLDTHTFLWWVENDPKLSGNARGLITEESCYLIAQALAIISIDRSFDAYGIERVW